MSVFALLASSSPLHRQEDSPNRRDRPSMSILTVTWGHWWGDPYVTLEPVWPGDRFHRPIHNLVAFRNLSLNMVYCYAMLTQPYLCNLTPPWVKLHNFHNRFLRNWPFQNLSNKMNHDQVQQKVCFPREVSAPLSCRNQFEKLRTANCLTHS